MRHFWAESGAFTTARQMFAMSISPPNFSIIYVWQFLSYLLIDKQTDRHGLVENAGANYGLRIAEKFLFYNYNICTTRVYIMLAAVRLVTMHCGLFEII
jgi:hypothetical protein